MLNDDVPWHDHVYYVVKKALKALILIVFRGYPGFKLKLQV